MRHPRWHPAITDVASIYNMGSLHNGILTVVYALAGVARLPAGKSKLLCSPRIPSGAGVNAHIAVPPLDSFRNRQIFA